MIRSHWSGCSGRCIPPPTGQVHRSCVSVSGLPGGTVCLSTSQREWSSTQIQCRLFLPSSIL